MWHLGETTLPWKLPNLLGQGNGLPSRGLWHQSQQFEAKRVLHRRIESACGIWAEPRGIWAALPEAHPRQINDFSNLTRGIWAATANKEPITSFN